MPSPSRWKTPRSSNSGPWTSPYPNRSATPANAAISACHRADSRRQHVLRADGARVGRFRSWTWPGRSGHAHSCRSEATAARETGRTGLTASGRAERVHPVDLGEAGEVGVGRVHGRARVRGRAAASCASVTRLPDDVARPQQVAEDASVPGARAAGARSCRARPSPRRRSRPGRPSSGRSLTRGWVVMRTKAHRLCHGRPDPASRRSGRSSSQPAASVVERAVGVGGVDEQVGVNQHRSPRGRRRPTGRGGRAPRRCR